MKSTAENKLAANRASYARNREKWAAAKRLKYQNDPAYKERKLEAVRRWRRSNPEKARQMDRDKIAKKPEQYRSYSRKYRAKIKDMLVVIREDWPELAKGFEL